MKPQRSGSNWRLKIAGAFRLAGDPRWETNEPHPTPAVPNLTYLEDSQFEEEAALVEPEPVATDAFAPAPQASAFAPHESARLSLPRLPGSSAERHDQEDRLEETFQQRAADIAAMISGRIEPTGATPVRAARPDSTGSPRKAPRRPRNANRAKFPGFELM